MKSKNKVFILIVILLILINIYSYVAPLFSESDKNLENATPELILSSNDLINAYRLNEDKSDSIYAGKIIEIFGFVKEITFLNNRNTIILNSDSDTFGVICDINPNQKLKIQQLKEHQKIRVKGICKGFLKDVILLNCSIDLLPNE